MKRHLDTKDVLKAIQLYEDSITIENNLSFLTNDRIKPKAKLLIPFSQRLNDFITKWYSENWDKFIFTEEDDFDGEDLEGTLQKHRDRYLRTGKIHIWTGASDKTIFSNPIVNHYFRAWHDYIHVTKNLGYDFTGEVAVCNIQIAQLPLDWGFERALVNSEIVGQALYFNMMGDFIDDQRGFTLSYLKYGEVIGRF